ncbi:hypothetical protein [Paenibacillus bovis]|uniref:Polyketide cyclase n=1 Tax=Paenibacillus bovis TaxID=1616788 RepID=A0A172ZDU3_9BACL|nr:hypothetical protein [Paenibacillus bovis]ANF95310.1 hypothetical protein AR543_04290 [Paenibacillus bovis]
MKHHYLFVSSWTIGTPREQLWELADHIENIDFWDNVNFEKVEQGSGPEGIGDVFRCTFKTKMLFRLSILLKVTDKQKPDQFTLEVEGPLSGIGTCFMSKTDDGQSTMLRCEWKVRIHHRLLRTANRAMRPVYIWSHDKVMDEGVYGLARQLNAEVTNAHHETTIYR